MRIPKTIFTRVLTSGFMLLGAALCAQETPEVAEAALVAIPVPEAANTNAPPVRLQPMPAAVPRWAPGEIPVMDPAREMLPGVGVLQLNPSYATINYATGESVGDGTGLFITTSLDRVAMLGLHKTAIHVEPERNDVEQFTGLCMWVKGDGSSAMGIVGLGPRLKHRFQFPLSSSEWQKLWIPWDKFSPHVDGSETVPVVTLGIVPPEDDSDFFYVQQLASYREELGTGRKRIVHRFPVVSTHVVPYRPMIVHYDQLGVETSDGLMMQVYGSGGASRGTVGWSWSDKKTFSFPTAKREPIKYFIPWEDLPAPYDVPVSKRYLRFQANSTLSGRHYMVVDRFHYYTDRYLEDTQPTRELQDPEPIKASFFYGGRDQLDALRKRLERKQRLSMVVLGDEVLQGYGMGFLEQNVGYLYEHSYWYRFARLLAREYHYDKELRVFYEVFAERSRQWVPVTAVMSDRKRLNVVAMGNNGTTIDFLSRNLNRIASYRADLLVVQYGMNDLKYSTAEEYRAGLEPVLVWAKEQGITVILGIPPPVADGFPHEYLEGSNYWHRGLEFTAVCRILAVKYDCVLVDTRAAIEARGTNRIGDYYTTASQLNHRGHDLLAKLYFGLFSKEDMQLFKAPFPKIDPVKPLE